MKHVLAGLLAFLVAFGVQVHAHAGNPPAAPGTQENSDLFYYQGVSLQNYSADNKALKDTGNWTWAFTDVPGCASESIRTTVTAGISQAARFGVAVQESDGNPNAHKVKATCGVDFASTCGGPPVIGCLGDGFPYNNTVSISTDMADYYDVSQRAIAMHEVIGHAMGVWNEQYKLDGSFSSSNDVTIMNTGPLSRHDLSTPEDQRWWRTMGSPELTTLGRGFNGTNYLWACNFDPNARRLSVLYDDGGGKYWSGVLVALKPDTRGCQGVGEFEGVVFAPGRRYYLKQESPASWAVSYNETLVP